MSTPVVNDVAIFKEETSGPRKWFNNQPTSSNPEYVVTFFEFIRGLEISATDWAIVKDTSATVAVGADAQNGTLIITSAATTDDDGGSAQSIQECFKLTVGKQMWWECRAQISDATQSEHFFGLSVAFATDPEAVLSGANRIGFAKLDGATTCSASVVATSVAQTLNTGQVWVAATNKILGMHWDGVNTVNFYVDRAYVGQVLSGIPTATAMAIALYNLSGDASGTKTATVDYVSVVTER